MTSAGDRNEEESISNTKFNEDYTTADSRKSTIIRECTAIPKCTLQLSTLRSKKVLIIVRIYYII